MVIFGPGSEKKWYSSENSPQGAWDDIAEQMLLEFAESGHPTFRATTPLSRGVLKRKGRGKLSIHFAADVDTIDTNYRIILSVNQLSVYGAVAAVCEEFESHQDRSGEPEILMGQSIVLGEVKAEVLLQNENPMNDQIIWQQYIQQVESLSPENKVSKFCKEAGFMRVVEVGQYFVTKDTGSLSQFRSVACREYTLPRDDLAYLEYTHLNTNFLHTQTHTYTHTHLHSLTHTLTLTYTHTYTLTHTYTHTLTHTNLHTH